MQYSLIPKPLYRSFLILIQIVGYNMMQYSLILIQIVGYKTLIKFVMLAQMRYNIFDILRHNIFT